MRNLVTGGAGFIGSHLCRSLLEQGEEVFCLDNLSSGQLRNVESLTSFANFKFIKADVVEPIELEVDRIYNLACPASPPFYQADPIQTSKTSVLGAINVLELARRTGARVLQASTSEVYGDPLEHPQSETYWGNVNPIGIRSCYDEGKRMAESLFFDYHRQYDVDIRVIRIFNTYGPNMRPDDGRVVSNFITQALHNRPITIYGDGSQTRSFCYVDDLVTGIFAAMNYSADLTGPFNLGNPNEFTVLELAQLTTVQIRSSSELKFVELPLDDPKQRRPDIQLARDLLGWEPDIMLADGILATAKYFSQLSS